MTGPAGSAGRTQDAVMEQIARAPLDAELSQDHEGAWTLLVRRVLAHPVERVWPMLTDPTQLARWSPIVPDRALTTTGPATAQEEEYSPAVSADVLACDPPHELVHRWGESRLRWRLRDVPDGTELTLAHTFADRATAPTYAAGWHVCLGTLSAVDAGHDVARVVGAESMDHGWQALHDGYARHLEPR